MSKIWVCTILALSSLVSFGQTERIDSLVNTSEKIQQTLSKKAALLQDSLSRSLQNLTPEEKIRAKVEGKVGNVKDRLTGKMGNPLDTLPALQKADSIKNALSGRLDDTQSKILDKTERLNGIGEGINSKFDRVNALGEGISNPLQGKVDIPNIALPELNLPTKDFSWEIPNIEALNLPDIKSRIAFDKIPHARQYLEGVKGVMAGNSDLPEQFLTQFKEVGELHRLRGQESEFEKVLEIQKQLARTAELNRADIKKEALSKSKNLANEKLKTHSDKITKAQQSMAKYKKKYTSLKSINDIPKFVPNAMKGKPLRDRIAPGFFMETKQETMLGFNLMPRVHYRVTGKVNVGLMGNYQLWFDRDLQKFTKTDPIYGVSTFAEVYGYKNYFVYSSYGRINTAKIIPDNNFKYRSWSGELLAGFGRSYKMGYRTKGKTQFLYHLNGENERWRDGLRIQTGLSINLRKSDRRKFLEQTKIYLQSKKENKVKNVSGTYSNKLFKQSRKQ